MSGQLLRNPNLRSWQGSPRVGQGATHRIAAQPACCSQGPCAAAALPLKEDVPETHFRNRLRRRGAPPGLEHLLGQWEGRGARPLSGS